MGRLRSRPPLLPRSPASKASRGGDREAREALGRTTIELERRTREVERFVYAVSHDLKSPLVTITGFLALLQEGLENGDRALVDRAVDRIGRSAARMSEMIDALLHLDHMRRAAQRTTVVDVVAELEGLRLLYEKRLEDAGAVMQIDESLPRVRANRDLLVQAFDNLLRNALEHAGAGESRLRVRFDHRLTRRDLEYRVRDNGPGIASEHHARVFRLFERLDTDAGGSGMGLAIVDGVLSAHGGHARVESTPGEGATFVLAFPRDAMAGGDEEAS